MLPRTLEPELMDSPEDAHEYDSMDHAAVNAVFVTDLINALTDWSLQRPVLSTLNVLDLGVGTAQIPIELSRRAPHTHITAVDAAESMLALARRNVAACRSVQSSRPRGGLANRIELVLADAKQLPFDTESFPVVISNSIIHHIADSRAVIAEAIRVTARGGLLFHRDLARPDDETQLEKLVGTYAATATPYQRNLFADSLRAALTLDEIRNSVAEFGFASDTVQLTSDRHWTWSAQQFA